MRSRKYMEGSRHIPQLATSWLFGARKQRFKRVWEFPWLPVWINHPSADVFTGCPAAASDPGAQNHSKGWREASEHRASRLLVWAQPAWELRSAAGCCARGSGSWPCAPEGTRSGRPRSRRGWVGWAEGACTRDKSVSSSRLLFCCEYSRLCVALPARSEGGFS